MLADPPPPVHKLPLHMWVQEARLGYPLQVAHLKYPLRTACGFEHCLKEVFWRVGAALCFRFKLCVFSLILWPCGNGMLSMR